MYVHVNRLLISFIDRVLLTAPMCFKKFTASHVRVASMKTCPDEDLTTPQWGIMNALMTLLSLNYLRTILYLPAEMVC